MSNPVTDLIQDTIQQFVFILLGCSGAHSDISMFCDLLFVKHFVKMKTIILVMCILLDNFVAGTKCSGEECLPEEEFFEEDMKENSKQYQNLPINESRVTFRVL